MIVLTSPSSGPPPFSSAAGREDPHDPRLRLLGAQPVDELAGRLTVIAVVVPNGTQDRRGFPLARFTTGPPAIIEDDRIASRRDSARSWWPIEAFQGFEGVVGCSHPQSVAHDRIEIHEDLVPEQRIDLGFAGAVPSHQLPQCGHFIGGVVVNVHARVCAPAGIDPIDKVGKGALFFIGVMRPPIVIVQRSFVMRDGTEQIFEPAVHQGIPFHIEGDVER